MAETKTVPTFKLGDPLLKRVEMIDGGRGGIKTTYTQAETRNGLIGYRDLPGVKIPAPVQRELRECFIKLRIHLLRMAGHTWPNDKWVNLTLANTVATFILTTKSGQMAIGGTILVYGLKTKIFGVVAKEEEYPFGEELSAIIDEIKTETNLYEKGLKGADTKTVVTDFMTIKKQITNAEEAYASMTTAEIEAITKEALDDSGLYVKIENGESVVALKEDDFGAEPDSFDDEDETEEPTNDADYMDEAPAAANDDLTDIPTFTEN